MKKLLTGLLALAMLTSVLSGCSSSKSANSNAKKTDTVNVGISSDIVSLDPAFAYDSTTVEVTDQVTEGLLGYGSDNKLVPRLAKSWKVVDNKTYVYEVRDDIKFSDGTPMTTDDVLFSLNRTKDPKTASNEGWMYANVASITKTGPWEITVKLSKPDSTWKYVFATTGGHIISQKYYEAHKDKFGKPEGGVLGTGPYIYKKWVTGTEVNLERNPNYWDKTSKIEINKINYKVIPDNSTLISAVRSNQVDVTLVPPVDTIDQYKAISSVNTIQNEGYQEEEIAFNCQRAPFDDVNVRRSVASAVDAVSIQKNILKSDVPANALPFGKKVAAFNTDEWEKFGNTSPYIKYDLKKAKEYLAKSRYPKGFTAEIVVSSTATDNNAICLQLQQTLKELNINLNIKKLPFNDFSSYAYGNHLDKNGKRDYDMLVWSWLSDWPDPAGVMSPLFNSANAGQGGANWSAYKNAQVDKLLDAQNNTLDNNQRTKYLEQAIAIANNEAAYVTLSYPRDGFIINKKFSYNPSASWFYNFYFKDFKVN